LYRPALQVSIDAAQTDGRVRPQHTQLRAALALHSTVYTMNRTLYAYAAVASSMLLLDLIWLGVVARPMYAAGIGHLMADKPDWVAAGLFYLIYAAGLLWFAVRPFDAAAGWQTPLLTAAAFGFVAYATYDLSNLATLKAWPWTVTLADMAWGSFASALAAGAGRWVWLRNAGVVAAQTTQEVTA
jgi:uncharacterized membrane protein